MDQTDQPDQPVYSPAPDQPAPDRPAPSRGSVWCDPSATPPTQLDGPSIPVRRPPVRRSPSPS